MQASLLAQVLLPANLCLAWEGVAENKGIPGVDDVSIAAWRRNWEERLVNLARQVRANRYRPQRLRRIQIPKKRPGEYRVLRIPTVTDRVLMRAVNQVLQPIYEAVFLDCSFGYRPKRGLREALERILAWRDAGLTWVLDGDIDACFDSIDNELLLRFLQEDLPDASLLPLLNIWMLAGKSKGAQSKGIPMGSPLSPLLANVFLHRLDLDARREQIALVRYADDFIALASAEEDLPVVYAQIGKSLENLGLRYKDSKTCAASFEQGFSFLGVSFLRDSYRFAWQGKQITVSGGQALRVFSDYLPEYE